ncbi:MAG: GspH/FimT family pseudopilin [Pseudomonadales bacterium]
MNIYKTSGFTLIEALISLTIVTILMGSAIPSITTVLERSRGTTNINWIISAVNFTRHAAVVHRTTMTLCAPKENADCGGDWHAGLIVFSDSNSNGKIDGEDRIVAKIQTADGNGTIKWRAFRNRPYLQMTQLGYTNFQNGNFIYCPADGNQKFARQIVLNVQGRTRLVHTKNKKGYPIDRYGRVLRC